MKTTRRLIQLAFVALTVVGVFIFKGNAERWCPFGGVEALYTYATQGNFTCSLGVSNFYILGAVLLMTLLLRRAFCGYVCPIGALTEFVQSGASRLGLRPWTVPYRLDRALGLLKYPVLIVILYFTWRAGELIFRGFGPCYVLIGRHGKDITFWAYIVSAVIVLGSLFVLVPFCRWLCPLAAVFTPFSRIGLTRIQRDSESCIDCGKCVPACPMGIQVDRLQVVTAARCTSCLDCIAVCPQPADATLTWGPPKALGRRWSQAALITIILACIGGAVAMTYALPMPSFVHERGERPARVSTLDLRIAGVSCRGTSSSLVSWLDRDDEYAPAGYLRVETWPGPGFARVRITYDPAQTSPAAVKRAIVTPYVDLLEGTFDRSPYDIEGYRPSVDDL